MLLAGVVFSSAVPSVSAQTATVTTFVRLGGTTDGFDPQSALVPDGAGNFYGTTEAGGPANYGTIFEVAADGTVTTLYTFTGGGDGGNPSTALVAGGDGNFYGVTPGTYSPAGGSSGTIFRVTPAGALTTVHTFTALDSSYHNSEGGYPQAGLVRGSDGNLYGTASRGGAHGDGTVFRATLSGAVTALYNFDGSSTTTPAGPAGSLTQGADGNFYGLTSYGGTNSVGVIYQVTPAGAFNVIYNFTGSGDGGGSSNLNALTLGTDGNLYGTAGSVAFKVSTAGAFTALHTFSSATEGNTPEGSLTLGSDGNFYGTNSGGGPGNGYGTVFKMTPAGAVSVVYTFPLVSSNGNEGALYGSAPIGGVIQGADGAFYGTTAGGGSLNNSSLGQGGGTVFKLTTAGALTTLKVFVLGGSDSYAGLLLAADGNFYGTTARGGVPGGGTIFAYSPAGALLGTHDFAPDTEGSTPGAALVQDPSGTIFGTTTQGGPTDGGGIFYFVPTTPAGTSSVQIAARRPIVSLYVGLGPLSFPYFFLSELGFSPEEIADILLGPSGTNASSGSTPQAAGEETLYGILTRGGPSSAGALYSYTVGASTPTILYEFGNAANDGLTPEGMLHASDGNFYGTTKAGGTANSGTVFKYVPGGTVTTLYSFAGTGDGVQPQAGLIEGTDGRLYGTTSYGSANDAISDGSGGTIFAITTGGSLTILHTFAEDGSEGTAPAAKLLQAGDGNFYGTTLTGGAQFSGTVFSITPTGVFTSLHSFDGLTGELPRGALIQGGDGALYGTTSGGGTDECGTIFRVQLAGAHPAFFNGEVSLGNGVYYLAFPSGNIFGYYSFLSDPHYIFHQDLGYEYVFDANDGKSGVYLYDFTSSDFFYTSPSFPFPYLFDFGLNSVVYYYPDPSNPGRYNTNGVRYFFVFNTGQIISK